MLDYLIQGAEIVDGPGAPKESGDIGVRVGVIVARGRVTEEARQVVDADGALATPGWIDVHTHYDGEVTWDDQIDPSASHGVPTVAVGNCGVGFAPVPKGGEQALIELMEGVEDIPGTALHGGMPWGAWESFPEYLDYLDTREYALETPAAPNCGRRSRRVPSAWSPVRVASCRVPAASWPPSSTACAPARTTSTRGRDRDAWYARPASC